VLAAGALTGRLSLMTLETPYPVPQAWNGTTCPGWPPAPVPGCAPAPQWNAVMPGANGTARGFSALCCAFYASPTPDTRTARTNPGPNNLNLGLEPPNFSL